MSQALWNARFGASLLVIFALLALLLCVIGIYGVIAYSVGQRGREIGIRMALGADRTEVLFMVLKESLAIVVLGLVAGLVLSYFLARAIVGLLYGVSPSEPGALVGMSLILAAAGLAASYFPARRAASVNPIQALHQE